MTETLEPSLRVEPIAPLTLVAPANSERRWRAGLGLAVAAGLAVRVAYVLATPHLHLGGDALYYHAQANLLARGHGFAAPFIYAGTGRIVASAYHPPLWTIYLAAFSIVGLKSWLTHRLAGCLLGAATIAIVGVLGRRIGGRTVGLIAAAVAAVYPLIWINDVVGMSESMVLLTCALVLVGAYRLWDRPTLARAGALGAMVALAALARSEEVLLLVALALPVIAFLRGLSVTRRFALLVVCGLSATVVMSPWLVRNLVAFDHPVLLSSNVEPTLVVSNCPSTFDPHSALYAFWDFKCFAGQQPPGDESDQNIYWRHQVETFLSQHKHQAVHVVVARIGRLWNLYRPIEGAQLDLIEDHPLWVSESGLLIFAALVPLAVAGAVVLRRRREPLTPLVALPVVATVTAVITYGATRFRAPAELSLILLAAVAAHALATRTWPAAPRPRSLTPPNRPENAVGGGVSEQSMPRRGGRFPCFDGYRAIAALAVIGVHAAFVSGFTFVHQAGAFTARLDIGVSIFFLISGFLLYRPFVAAHLEGRPQPRLGPYLRRRALRIIPAYWLALTLIAFVFHDTTIHGLRQIVVYYGFLQIYFHRYVIGGISQAWSLCTEVTFYLFLPVWALLLRAVGRRLGLRPDQSVALELWGLVTLFVAGVVSGGVMTQSVQHGHLQEGWLNSLLPNLDLFALGMGLAVVSVHSQRAPAAAAETAGRRPWAWWIAAVAVFWFVATQFALPRDLSLISPSQFVARHLLYGLFAFLLLVPGVFGRQDQGLIRRVLRSRVVAGVGVVSYGVYLWHQAVIAEFLKRFDVPLFHGHLKTLVAFTVLVSIGVATASYLAFERPALRLKGDR